MRITTKSTDVTVTRRTLVADGPILPQPYSQTGKRFRVERITIVYTLRHGHWNVAYSSDINLGGTALKKDGTDSKVDHVSSPTCNEWWNRDDELPWLVEIINRLRPHGVSALFHGEFEVEQ